MNLRITFLFIASLSVGCAPTLHQFPLEEALWQDPDQQPFAPAPEEYYSPFFWDAANQMVFRPMSRVFAVDPAGEAENVNAFDEVANSSWFTNRIGLRDMSVEEVIHAACGGDGGAPNDGGPWTIISAKPNGANPGFNIEDATGRKFLLKFDSPDQAPRGTAADVSGSIYYYAAGFHAPCNRVIFFDPDILTIPEGATYENPSGDEVPLTMDIVTDALSFATPVGNGIIRGSSSLFIDGRPIGPWTYEGTRSDDPNDVINHEDRRELRGGRLLAAWFNHTDAREQNTLSGWVSTDEESGAGYVRHYYIDFGDCYGSLWPFDGITRRLGHSGYFNVGDIAADFVSLGIIPRAYRTNRMGPAGQVFAYFDVDSFDPDGWDPAYGNPAFSRASERDNAWMARIISQFAPEHIEAIADFAAFQRPLLRNEISRILKGRQQKILRRYFRQLSPLTLPSVEPGPDGASLCVRDFAVEAEVADRFGTSYQARAWSYDGDINPLEPPAMRYGEGPSSVCAALPTLPGATRDDPGYLVVDVLAARGETDDRSAPLRVHLYHLGGAEYVVAGLERPYDRDGL
ncbi:MAG: hypothetical protein AAGF12_11740 [Myxococcota bacterium]